jgi:hypothetical protein
MMSLAWRASTGAISRWIAWISSLVSVPARLKKTEETRSSASPLRSNAAIVLSKLGSAGPAAIASTSLRCRAIAASKAGRKCPVLISAKGGAPNGPVQSLRSGLRLSVSAMICLCQLGT